jgi:hypothetical protein
MLKPFAPVTGADLERQRIALNLSVAEYCCLLGLSMRKWCEITKDKDSPVPDAAIAILARAIDQDNGLAWVPTFPKPQDVFQQLALVLEGRGEKLSPRHFGVALGRDGTSSYRWIDKRQPPGPFVNRTLLALQQTLTEHGYDGWATFVEIAETEAQARGVGGIFDHGKWQIRKSELGSAEAAE